MECPTCKAPYQPGDRFCGNCGERLPAAEPAPAAPPSPPVAAGRQERPAYAAEPVQAAVCSTCGAPRIPGQARCQVCGAELPAAVSTAPPAPMAAYRPEADPAARSGARPEPVPTARAPQPGGAICPIHGQMDPTWTR